MPRVLKAAAVAVGLYLAAASGARAAVELSAEQKQDFLRSVCEGWERAADCVSTGKLVVGHQSIMWIIYEACSNAGTMAVIIRCFDRASDLASQLTGDPVYADTKKFCHRFEGESVEFATAVCFRKSLKLRNYIVQHYPIGSPE